MGHQVTFLNDSACLGVSIFLGSIPAQVLNFFLHAAEKNSNLAVLQSELPSGLKNIVRYTEDLVI